MRLVKRLLCAALLLYVSTCVVARVSTAGVSVKKVPANKAKKTPLKVSALRNKRDVRPDSEDGSSRGRKRRSRGWEDKENQFGHRSRRSHSDSRRLMKVVHEKSVPISATIASQLEAVAAQGKDVFKSVVRSAKVLKSSAFEALLLKATWPDDAPVPRRALHQIIYESIPAFEKYMELSGRGAADDGDRAEVTPSRDGYSGCEDPYYMTNHKLYMKMVELDWRTTLKSLYIFQSIFRESSPSVSMSFRQAMNDMRRKRALRQQTSNYKYFDRVMIADTDADNDELNKFILNVARFVLHRAKHFSYRYDEVKDAVSFASDNENFGRCIKTLKNAKQNLDLGLLCSVPEGFEDNAVVVDSYRLIAKDMLDNWVLFSQALSSLVKKYSENDKFLDTQNKYSQNLLISLIDYHKQVSDKVKIFFAKDRAMMRMYRNAIKSQGYVPSIDVLRDLAGSLGHESVDDSKGQGKIDDYKDAKIGDVHNVRGDDSVPDDVDENNNVSGINEHEINDIDDDEDEYDDENDDEGDGNVGDDDDDDEYDL